METTNQPNPEEQIDAISETTQDAVEEVKETIENTSEAVAEVVEEAPEVVAEAASDTIDEVTETAAELTSDVSEEVTTTIEGTSEEAEQVVETTIAEAAESVEDAVASADDIVEDVTSEAETAVETTISEAAETVDDAVANADESVDEVVEKVVETAKEEAPEKTKEPAAAKPAQDDSGLRRGDVIEGTITKTSPTSLLVDLGEDRIGEVPGRELELMPRRTLETLKVGDSLTVYVVNPKTNRGKIRLSINLAEEEKDWQRVKQFSSDKSNFEGNISGYNKGGLIVRFGRLRGFVPHSQLSDFRTRQMSGETPEERYGKMVGEPISVKVMEVDRKRNRLIFSERAAMRELRESQKEKLVEELDLGEERDGIVTSLESFGAFVDVGGAEGLVHLTEISWMHITHPKQVYAVGDKVRVKVIKLDKENHRIGLSIRQLQDDPWDEIAAAFVRGQLVRGRITKLSNFGAFAEIQGTDQIEGLIHISELSDGRVEHPRDVVKRGDIRTLRVIKIDVKNRRLGLSLKRVNSSEYLDLDMRFAYQLAETEPEEVVEQTAEPVAEATDTAEEVEEVVAEETDTAESDEAVAEVEENSSSDGEANEETAADKDS